ncbi:3-ketoacyl-ACP reductase [Anatilimnocola sp. NA78]|uniref:3-ketoacyl-ACP reductase n=1 Tax=Anatilimnocola sp. NA78 TaxID=3415683 RepID=UPI003CE59258
MAVSGNTPSTRPVAIVTGGSRGIGRSIAERLAADGFAVVINYFSRRDAADEVASTLQGAGGEALVVQADVGMTADRQRLIAETMAHFGRLDLLVNNAGITSPGRKDLLEATEESWDQVFATNLKGPFFLAQAAANEMVQQKQPGTIINISSISAFAVSTNRADYCMAKAAMQMMTWLLATRLADEQIRVYEICPGVIASDMTAPVQEKYDKLIADGMSPIRRWGQPGDVAASVSMLASGSLPFSTGERIHVDGGFHIRRL